MLNKLLSLIRNYDMIRPGDRIYCAVSGGPDSMALLQAMCLLQKKLQIQIFAAHFNHHLRGAEANRDADFVKKFCEERKIPFVLGEMQVQTGEKGLESAARDARYTFLEKLPGKIATAHNADDNAETVLMRMVRGTGLKGLGAIAPVRGRIIRPMLLVTRKEITEFLREQEIPWIQDSSNDSDDFLRNRLRHHVMPLLLEENPGLSVSWSEMALRLREDEKVLADEAEKQKTDSVSVLRKMPAALRSRVLSAMLEDWGIREPEAEHVALAENLVFSDSPSAKADFPGNIRIGREYDRLVRLSDSGKLTQTDVNPDGVTEIPEAGFRISCCPSEQKKTKRESFTVCPKGKMIIRSRMAGDSLRLSGGTKTVKKLMIDLKIPASERDRIPVLADEGGILAVAGIGANLDRIEPGVLVEFRKM